MQQLKKFCGFLVADRDEVRRMMAPDVVHEREWRSQLARIRNQLQKAPNHRPKPIRPLRAD